ncbi:phage tail sheath C-terminal domain-containing protein [Kribbella sp. CA-247076]|uniref:phage tail sheath C-terminal domain-containing protein n=1 Tax=Kribbella sp. CA-247076 TaxID=3239941 RepID=UPI003D8FEE26
MTGAELGAPGVYLTEVQSPPAFTPVRLDVAGFVGVAARGPVDVPTPVNSWSEYQWLFGDIGQSPGGLGTAVHAFFAQGGVRALILRVSPLPRASGVAVALHRLTFTQNGTSVDLTLAARNEGAWGNGLTITYTLGATTRFTAGAGGRQIAEPAGLELPPGTLLRVWLDDGRLPTFRWVESSTFRDDGRGRRTAVAVLDDDLDGVPEPADGEAWRQSLDVDVITAGVVIVDRADDVRRQERFDELGMCRLHPRAIGAVLSNESLLVRPDGQWPDRIVPPDVRLVSIASTLVREAVDRFDRIEPGSFFGDVAPEEIPIGGIEPCDQDLVLHGVDRMTVEPEIGLLSAPDLLWDAVVTPVQIEPVRLPTYPISRPCEPPELPIEYERVEPVAVLLEGGGASLDQALVRQQRVVALAERQRRFVALLDVPDGLAYRDITRWRTAIDSSYAAAYHPWLGTVAENRADRSSRHLRRLAPSAVAAGITAGRERRLGIPWGPAAEIAVDAVRAARDIGDAEHDNLHRLGINVFRAERDGFRLAAAHTLTRHPDLRQLSVRRLMTMLALVLERQGQWLAFEPNTPGLRRELKQAVTRLLRDLYRDGAFAGATEEEAFWVQCDDALNPPWLQQQGRLVAEIGVSPATPLEFIVLRLSRDAAGTVGVEG